MTHPKGQSHTPDDANHESCFRLQRLLWALTISDEVCVRGVRHQILLLWGWFSYTCHEIQRDVVLATGRAARRSHLLSSSMLQKGRAQIHERNLTLMWTNDFSTNIMEHTCFGEVNRHSTCPIPSMRFKEGKGPLACQHEDVSRSHCRTEKFIACPSTFCLLAVCYSKYAKLKWLSNQCCSISEKHCFLKSSQASQI